MELLITVPRFPLNTLVRSFIYYRGYNAPGSTERLLPDGNTQVVIPLDGNPRILRRNCNSQNLNLSLGWITGLQTEAVDYAPEINATTLGIQLQPGALARISGHDTQAFTDWMVGLELLPQAPFKYWQEQLRGLTSGHAVIAAAEALLIPYLSDTEDTLKFINFFTRALANGTRNIEEISLSSGYSHKHFIHRFKRLMGVSPKAYQRLVRFNHSLLALHNDATESLVDLALENTYSDQSHFNHEFKRFSGFSPMQYLKQNRLYPHVIALD